MEQKQKILYHQIHPAKLATDIGCAALSFWLFWEHQLVLALVVHVGPPIVASYLLVRYADLTPYQNSPFGRYVARYMTRTFEFIRLAGDVLIVLGAWFHRPQLMIAGLFVIMAAWGNGFLRPKHF